MSMRFSILLLHFCVSLCFCLFFSAARAQENKYHLFFLHNRFLEEHSLEEAHPLYGKVEYQQILSAYKEAGFTVHSEIRTSSVNARDYAQKIVTQIDSLVAAGVLPSHITVVDTSKGGYIAQYVSTLAKNADLNFVFIGSFRESDLQRIPEINYCGNILTIYEKSDEYGVSAISRKESSLLPVTRFREIALNTELKHGFLFKALPEWLIPSIAWARQHYDFKQID